uniref:T-cell surface glycoprotein CD3 zeta chain n=1 Tax=Oryzias sinensis TaxID=183150 RepID=A0A8C7ZP93_9TELE
MHTCELRSHHLSSEETAGLPLSHSHRVSAALLDEDSSPPTHHSHLSAFPPETTMLTDPRLCYILDGFLGLYGLIITGMFIKEKVSKLFACSKSSFCFQDIRPITAHHRDPEQGRVSEPHYLSQDEYRELPVKERPRRNEQVYQDLSAASRDTYDALQVQALPAR